jgi:hypothetical protein
VGEIMLMCALSLQLSLLFVVWQVIYFPQFVLLSSVDIATCRGLDDPGIESRWEARFSTYVQTGSGAHPASCTVGTGSFPGLNRPGCGIDHPPPSSAKVEERVELYLYSTSGPSLSVLG